MAATGSRTTDANGNPIMLADSQTASHVFGFNGGTLQNVPKSKFLFYVKFYRPENQGGSDWLKNVGSVAKTVDRPKITFNQEVLNQYNRKRIVQTSHELESIQIKFHDTVDESVIRMFVEYYQYYYGDSKINDASSSVYDIVTPEPYELGKWGFQPPLVNQNYGYFFSHISVYQLFGGKVIQFDLINPKIVSYNPDEFDYAGTTTAEIQITINYESIVFHDQTDLTADMITEMKLDAARYWDVEDTPTSFENAGLAINSNEITTTLGDTVVNVLRSNLASLVTGQGTQSIGSMIGSVASAYDANRSLAVGITGTKALKDLVSGNTSSAKQGAQGLLKGVLYGKPGSLF